MTSAHVAKNNNCTGLTADKRCPHCLSGNLTLCEDLTRYTHIEAIDDELVVGLTRTENSIAEDATRLMCNGCGDYLPVPKELR